MRRGHVSEKSIAVTKPRTTVSALLARAEMAAGEEPFRQAVIEAPCPVMLHREDGQIVCISRAFAEISGYVLKDIPTIADWTTRAFGSQAADVRARIGALYGGTQRTALGPYTVHTKEGQARIWDVYSSPLGGTPGHRLVLCMAADVTSRAETDRKSVV